MVTEEALSGLSQGLDHMKLNSKSYLPKDTRVTCGSRAAVLSAEALKGEEEDFMTEINNLLTNNLLLDPRRPAQETPRISLRIRGTFGKEHTPMKTSGR